MSTAGSHPDYSQFRHLEVSLEDDGIAVVTFSPVDEQHVEDSFFHEIGDILRPLARDRRVSAVVFTGTGDNFTPMRPSVMAMLESAPLHISAMRMISVQQFAGLFLTFPKPTVAAVNGQARAIGAEIAFLADAAVAATGVTFTDLHVAVGLPAGDGGTMFWPLLVGVARAREVLLRGKSLSADEALELHLVDRIVPASETVEAAKELARELAALPPLPYLASKVAINNHFRAAGLVSWDLASAYEAVAIVQPRHS